MFEEIEFEHDELFTELAELEQESVAGGYALEDSLIDFFFQKTDIDSLADSEVELPDGASSAQKSKYSFSQITLGFTLRGSNSSISQFRFGTLFNLLLHGWGD